MVFHTFVGSQRPRENGAPAAAGAQSGGLWGVPARTFFPLFFSVANSGASETVAYRFLTISGGPREP